MKLREYQNQAMVTDIRNENIKMICNGYGFIGELEEVEQEQEQEDCLYEFDILNISLLKEIGDVLWYCASICTCLGLDLQDIYYDCGDSYDWHANYSPLPPLAEIFKKAFRDNNGVFSTQAIADIRGHIRMFVLGIPENVLDTATDMNIAKLASRQERGVIGGSGSNR